MGENPASKAELQMENTQLKRQLERSKEAKARMQSEIMRMQSQIMRMQSKIMQLERQNSELRRAVLRSESRSMFSLFFKTFISAITIVLCVSIAPRNMAAAHVQPHQGQSGREVVMQRAPSLPQSMPHRYELLWWQIGSAMSRSC